MPFWGVEPRIDKFDASEIFFLFSFLCFPCNFFKPLPMKNAQMNILGLSLYSNHRDVGNDPL